MVPTDERLDAAHAARHRVNLRLVHENELSTPNACAEILLQGEPLDGSRMHVLEEDLVTILAVSFADVHRGIGVAHDVGGCTSAR